MSNYLVCQKFCPVVRDLKMHSAELNHDVSNRECEIRDLRCQIDNLQLQLVKTREERDNALNTISKITNATALFQAGRLVSGNSKITGGP